MLLRRRKLLWSLVKMLWSSRRTQPTVDCLWSLVSSFPGLSVNSDNLPFPYVILFLLFTYVNYMHENRSWHAYRFALGFLWKNRCDRVVSELYRLKDAILVSNGRFLRFFYLKFITTFALNFVMNILASWTSLMAHRWLSHFHLHIIVSQMIMISTLA
jgi:hypothetical protein